MSYGTIKVDTITFTDNSVDKSVSLSGLIQNPTFTGNITVTGTISGDVIRGGTTVSGATVTGTTANFVSGVFTTQISGATVTGTTASFTSGVFTNISGTTATITSGIIASGTDAAPSLAILADLDTGLFSPGANQLAVATNGTGRLFVSSAGDIQVGAAATLNAAVLSATADPASKNLYLAFNGTTTGADFLMGGISANANGTNIGTVDIYRGSSDNHGYISFRTKNGTTLGERLHITSAGLVGIGTSSPGGRLVVADPGTAVPTTGYGTGLMVARADGLIGLAIGDIGSGNASYLQAKNFTNADTKPIALNPSGGNVGIGTTAPSALLHLGVASAAVDGTKGVRIANLGGTVAMFECGVSSDSYIGTLSASDFSIRTNNAPRISVTNAGNVGIGTTSPDAELDVNGRIYLAEGNELAWHNGAGAQAARIYGSSTDELRFDIGSTASRALTIDSSGRLLVGTSISVTGTNQPQYAKLQVVGNTLSGARSGLIALGRSAAASTIVAGDQLGGITFGDNAAGEFAYIFGEADGTAGTDDYPGRLVFSTTADGESSPTERMRWCRNCTFFPSSCTCMWLTGCC
jgi:hypothetical protein